MIQETTFVVRIFVYGLVGLVQGSPQTTALLPVEDDHIPFVAFENGSACKPNCSFMIGGKTLTGFKLDKDQIAWIVDHPVLKNHVRQPRIQIPRGFAAPLPLTFGSNHVDSSAFFWVPSMADIANSGQIAAACLDPQDPNKAGCNMPKGLSGRVVFDTGVLSTCRLIEFLKKGQQSGQGRVHAFEFEPPVRGVVLHDQAIAEIVESEVQVSSTSLTLTLTPFGASKPRATAKITPSRCKGRAGNDFCVDLFVGNIVKPGGPEEQDRGVHFAALYNLLKVQPSERPIPIRDKTNSLSSPVVQPLCREVPPPAPAPVSVDQLKAAPRRLLPKRERRVARELDNYLTMFYPSQRVICPMGAFTEKP